MKNKFESEKERKTWISLSLERKNKRNYFSAFFFLFQTLLRARAISSSSSSANLFCKENVTIKAYEFKIAENEKKIVGKIEFSLLEAMVMISRKTLIAKTTRVKMENHWTCLESRWKWEWRKLVVFLIFFKENCFVF